MLRQIVRKLIVMIVVIAAIIGAFFFGKSQSNVNSTKYPTNVPATAVPEVANPVSTMVPTATPVPTMVPATIPNTAPATIPNTAPGIANPVPTTVPTATPVPTMVPATIPNTVPTVPNVMPPTMVANTENNMTPNFIGSNIEVQVAGSNSAILVGGDTLHTEGFKVFSTFSEGKTMTLSSARVKVIALAPGLNPVDVWNSTLNPNGYHTAVNSSEGGNLIMKVTFLKGGNSLEVYAFSQYQCNAILIK